ncbi:MAG: T9SS type A sorting domain-containing protein [Flavobacteriales bacterium]|nr:T9SS type A sorting domain-containing protein [Flavobacteriales bacterium]
MNTSTLRQLGFSLSVALLSTSMVAQGTVDIGLKENDGHLDVMVRPTTDFDGVFSSVVFTLRWERSSNVVFGDMEQPEGPASYIPLMRSGPVHENGPYNYQVYAGFGMESLTSRGLSWEAGKEYTIMSLPFSGVAEVELADDAWTGELLNNADYYTSLGGKDRTGIIYQRSVSTTDIDGTVLIQPNPNNGLFTFSFVVAEATDLQVDIVNALGQNVFNDLLRGFEGTYRKEMDLTNMSNGIYYLKITREGSSSVHKIVYR